MSIEKKIKLLFAARVILWIIALISTGYWMWYSGELYDEGFYDPFQYSSRLRPVLYTGVIIAVAAICISFVLYGVSRKLKKQMNAPEASEEGEDMTDQNPEIRSKSDT